MVKETLEGLFSEYQYNLETDNLEDLDSIAKKIGEQYLNQQITPDIVEKLNMLLYPNHLRIIASILNLGEAS
jgi:hypothetical protein